MSNAQKKPEPNAEDVFSIDFDDQGKSNMPGVTQLINPEVLRRRAEAQAAAAAKTSPQRAPTTAPAPAAQAKPTVSEATSFYTAPAAAKKEQTLAEMGVRLELQFESKQGFFQFVKFKPHQKEPEAWQEKFFNQMKIDLKSLQVTTIFQEFEAMRSSFHQDTFGLKNGEFVQIIRPDENSKQLYVLLSNQALFSKKIHVLEKFAVVKNDDSDDEFKIELA